MRRLNNCGKKLLNIIILDACRYDEDNNTWKTNITNEQERPKPIFGHLLKDHVRLPTESQFALIFSCDPGTVSYSGNFSINGNSLFTSVLLNHLMTPNLNLSDLKTEVNSEMLNKSNKQQKSWLHDNLHESFYFNKGL